MIYTVCGTCGYVIDIFGKEDEANPIRGKRLKYLLTRDQICPNCLVAIAHCQRVEAEEGAIPIFNVDMDMGADEKEKVRAFAKERGYALVTEFAINQYKHPETTVSSQS